MFVDKFEKEVRRLKESYAWCDSFLTINIEDLVPSTYEELKLLTGIIYLIYNKINRKIYVGQTLRFFLDRYTKNWYKEMHNEHLLKSINKYGFENFQVYIIHSNKYLDELNFLETYYIIKLKTYDPDYGYNMSLGGNSRLHTLEVRKKISIGNKGKCIGKKSSNWGKFGSLNHQFEPFEKWAEKCKKIHESKYIYTSDGFFNSRTKIKVICKICSTEFLIEPKSHTQGVGCPKCARILHLTQMHEAHKIKFGLTYDKFCEKAKILHGDIYTYDKSGFVNLTTPICITGKYCDHSFIRSPGHHLNDVSVCPSCDYITKHQLTRFARYKPVKCISEDNSVTYYLSVRNACKIIKGSEFHVRECCRGLRNNYRNYKWEYTNDIEKYTICLKNLKS